MSEANKCIVFLCSSAIKKGDGKLSFRLVQIGLASIGRLEDLFMQHATPRENQHRLIFLNDCKSGCVRVLTHGFDKEMFIFIDVYEHVHAATFDMMRYVREELIPQLNAKWNVN